LHEFGRLFHAAHWRPAQSSGHDLGRLVQLGEEALHEALGFRLRGFELARA
jgi:hypothetical protein